MNAAWAEYRMWVAVFSAAQEQVQAEAEGLLLKSRPGRPLPGS